MKKIIIVIPLLLCSSIVAFTFLGDSEERTNQQAHDKFVQQQNTDPKNLSKSELQPLNSKKPEKNKLAKTVSDSTSLKELRKRISSAVTAKEFIHAVSDINDADYNDLDPLIRDRLIRELYDSWVAIDPLAALDYSDTLSKRYEDTSFRTYALELAATHNIRDAQEWLYHNNTGSQREQDANTLAVYSGFAVNEPVEALQKIDEIQDIYTKHLLELRALKEWAKTEPEHALAWIENDISFTHGINVNNAYLAVVSPLIEHSPTQAEPVILAMESGEQKNTLVTQYTQKLALEDSDAAIRWAQNITDDQAYKEAVSTTLEVIAGSDQNQIRAVEYAKEESDPELREHFVIQTIGYMAHKSPEIAAKQLSSLTFDQQKDAALSIAYMFPEDDPERMHAWLDALPNEELREIVSAATSD